MRFKEMIPITDSSLQGLRQDGPAAPAAADAAAGAERPEQRLQGRNVRSRAGERFVALAQHDQQGRDGGAAGQQAVGAAASGGFRARWVSHRSGSSRVVPLTPDVQSGTDLEQQG